MRRAGSATTGWCARRRSGSVGDRVRAGEDLRFAVRELLDEFALRGRDDLRAAALAEEPASVDPHVDAYLGALAESSVCHRAG